ncbi:MAG: DUF4922 domain-containing protein [Bacteroidales bacterium]|nr:DUF4922 domain-containing protein [Bacteroidales bacterium]
MTGPELTRGVDLLFENQLRDWDLARTNYSDLRNARLRTFNFEGFRILVQFNPKRIRSSAAKVDPVSIQTRPCFLCERNRPPEQQSIRYKNDFNFLVNPYPVFPGHLTVPSVQHVPQRIRPNFSVMLEIAGNLPRYTVIYNGPLCGASAPDHFHFQAVPKQNLPIEEDFRNGIKCEFKSEIQGVSIYTWDKYLRNLITLTGNDIPELNVLFNKICDFLTGLIPALDDEPMMNIIAGLEGSHYVVHIIPRKLHRPDRYFSSGARQLLLSPASLDLGGVLIMPRKEDFDKITETDIADVFEQVGVDGKLIQYLVNNLT